ncbi:MAG: hypothetical protein LUQ71_02565 [Methanoregula sp.]|nr:hypothetical protein [Methanoregula sp.]
MATVFQDPVPPFPGWERRMYRLSRPVTEEDIRAFLGDQELYIRETASGTRVIIHKYGLVEINLIVGAPEAEVWFNPESGAYPSEYLDALLATRF